MGTDQLYQDEILKFARMARGHGRLDTASYSAQVKNPSCGDLVNVDVTLDDDGRVCQIGIATDGCALCEASAGFLISIAPGRHRHDFTRLHDELAAWLGGNTSTMITPEQEAFRAVRDFTSRHTCVCLPFKAAVAALSST